MDVYAACAPDELWWFDGSDDVAAGWYCEGCWDGYLSEATDAHGISWAEHLRMSEHTPEEIQIAKLRRACNIHKSTIERRAETSRVMLEALEEARRLIGLRDEWTFAGRHETLNVIDAVIAKARGETS